MGSRPATSISLTSQLARCTIPTPATAAWRRVSVSSVRRLPRTGNARLRLTPAKRHQSAGGEVEAACSSSGCMSGSPCFSRSRRRTVDVRTPTSPAQTAPPKARPISRPRYQLRRIATAIVAPRPSVRTQSEPVIGTPAGWLGRVSTPAMLVTASITPLNALNDYLARGRSWGATTMCVRAL